MDSTFTQRRERIIKPPHTPIMRDSSEVFGKRVFDLIFALFALVFICSWLFPIIAVAIKFTSKGPVFFKQLRHGKDNVPFYCYKFRTMRVNNEADILQAVKNDKRITAVGRFLRRTSLDELPQIINVISGEMSIVGSRALAVPMIDVFLLEIVYFLFRHAVKPGITGLAQCKGYRGEIKDFFDIYSRYKLDMFYVKKWCFYFDFIIIVQTLATIWIKNEKAY